MDKFIRIPTKSTPYIHLDATTETFVIAGRSIPLDAEMLYSPVLNWLDGLAKSKTLCRLDFCFRLDFFNIASSKRILFVLYKLVELQKCGFVVSIRWMSEKHDDDMYEIGCDYATMIDDLQFSFETYDSKELHDAKMLKFG